MRRPAVRIIPGKGSLSRFAAGRSTEWMEMAETFGGLLFRGFSMTTPSEFHESAMELTGGISVFPEESSPRSAVGQDVFTATDYSSEAPIQFHSEHSYAYEWPHHLVFGCLRPSRSGGRTLLSDTRRVLRELPANLLQEFTERGVLYLRNYSDRRGVSWQASFGVRNLDQLGEFCASRRIDLKVAHDGLVRTRQTGPAVRQHPGTGEDVWFNHAFLFNVAAIQPGWLRDFMRSQPPEMLVTQSFFGDGGEISEASIDLIGQAYRTAMLEPEGWEPGDVLVIDNMLLAHAREAYTGERDVLVAMAGAMQGTDDEVGSPGGRAGWPPGAARRSVARSADLAGPHERTPDGA